MFTYFKALFGQYAYAGSAGDFCSSEVTGGFTNATACSNWILSHGSTLSSSSYGDVVMAFAEDVLDRSIDVLYAYWPTILTVAVTIGVAFFLISKAISAVRGHI